MGESFIIVNLITERLDSEDDGYNATPPVTKLRLKLFGGPSTGEVFYFKPEYPEEASDAPHSIVKIGRSNQCDVVIEDAVLSKLQAHIYFDPARQTWLLEDGAIGGGKRSLNGTWLYLNDDFEVYEGMTFKVNQVLFQASFQAREPHAYIR